MAASRGPGLYEFLIEAELQQYYSGLKTELKVQNVPQLKYVMDDDLYSIGMSKPEVRRLKKFFQKHYPQTYLSKFKKLILSKREESNDTFLPVSSELVEKPSIKVPNKHIIPAENILVNKELGQGEFGVVQQGVWTDEDERIQVAIKCLSRERMHNNPIEFLKEAAIMHSNDHEHIVRLHGVVLDTDSLMLVTELAPLRSLLECLKEPSLRSSFPVLSLCDFAVQICDGMQYLEQKRLIHRDLAARNILVFSKNKVKISDFGLSRALGVGKDYYQTNFNVNLKLPIAWCAPECISYLRFTTASDVWAYGVTLWEMFSYGFQPWAALTGQQILEAIDEPNCQRLEQPECCPKEYYTIMIKCWEHDPNRRPRFADLMSILPECKPEQVKAVQGFLEESGKARRDQLIYRVGDVITVLDKQQGCWKGVLQSGKTGLFNPAHTVTYLGNNLPSSKSELTRGGDGRNTFSSSSRRKLRTDMISGPQGELKHMGHVGLDGAYFGDLSFLGGKTPSLPRQVVAPYKPHEDVLDPARNGSDSDSTPLLKKAQAESAWAENNKVAMDHEYFEISDDENDEAITSHNHQANGNGSPIFNKSFDYGPSLLDEMESVLGSFVSSHHQHQRTSSVSSERKNSAGSIGGGKRLQPPAPFVLPPGVSSGTPPSSPLAEAINVRNELKEMAAKAKTGRKQAAIKPISQAEAKTLDTAIAKATELVTRTLSHDIDTGVTPPESPHTPSSPTKRKFSFRFPSTQKMTNSKNCNKNFTDQVSDIQSVITPEAQQVYSSLVEQTMLDTATVLPVRKLTPIYGRQPIANFKTFGQAQNSGVQLQCGGGIEEMNPLRMVRAGVVPVVRTKPRAHSDPKPGPSLSEQNPIPLPPRDRTRLTLDDRPRHRRRHPLVMPGGGEDPAISPCSDDNNDVFLPSPTLSLSNQSYKLPNDNSGDIFEEQIATELDALDALESNSPRAEHVSCEDLLAFSSPPHSKSRGLDSDEARIILKVLGREVTPEKCLEALDTTDWDVHGTIKLLKLYNALKPSNRLPELSECWRTLNFMDGNVDKASSLILSKESPPDLV